MQSCFYYDIDKEEIKVIVNKPLNLRMGVREMGNEIILANLKLIKLDFENMVFEINGHSINHCTDVDITFHNGEWSVSICEKQTFGTSGRNTKEIAAQQKRWKQRQMN